MLALFIYFFLLFLPAKSTKLRRPYKYFHGLASQSRLSQTLVTVNIFACIIVHRFGKYFVPRPLNGQFYYRQSLYFGESERFARDTTRRRCRVCHSNERVPMYLCNTIKNVFFFFQVLNGTNRRNDRARRYSYVPVIYFTRYRQKITNSVSYSENANGNQSALLQYTIRTIFGRVQIERSR